MKIFIVVMLLLLAFLFYYFGYKKRETLPPSSDLKSSYIYGLTLDSISDIEQSVDAIKKLSRATVTRVVFDEIPAKEYEEALRKLAPHTDIMGELFDSEYIKNYSMKAYKKRVDAYLDAHGDKVAIWEIGNEVNGEWTGKPDEVAKKTIYGYREAKKRGYKTALTLYYNDFKENDGCWAKPEEKMREWATKRLNREIKEGIEYLFVSYYEEDCDNHKPTRKEWEEVFGDLGEIFPNAKLGFGEVGISKKREKEAYLKRYYGLDIQHPRYVGGHFWWYFKQDMVPQKKRLWSTFDEVLREREVELSLKQLP
jgi:hypothetical protein